MLKLKLQELHMKDTFLEWFGWENKSSTSILN